MARQYRISNQERERRRQNMRQVRDPGAGGRALAAKLSAWQRSERARKAGLAAGKARRRKTGLEINMDEVVAALQQLRQRQKRRRYLARKAAGLVKPRSPGPPAVIT